MRTPFFTAAAALALSGCVGGTTYGTGVSQEAQLLADVGNLTSLGTGKKRETIDYNARPGLLPPPADGSLPAPASGGTVSTQDNFPVDPEQRRANLRNAVDGDPALEEARAEARKRSRNAEEYAYHETITSRNYGVEVGQGAQDRETRQEVLRKRAQARAITGPGPRRYLTEPKATYRTPADTASAGELGERINERAPVDAPTHEQYDRKS